MQITPHLIYQRLFSHFGPQQWWPMDTVYHKKQQSDPRFEVIIGAILTQNTAWSNVEKAIENLRKEHLLSLECINDVDITILREQIKPSGFFNQKADRLKSISAYIQETYHGQLDDLFKKPIPQIRTELLSLTGIGPETADSIILYAGYKPIFVVDAYTKRLCIRLNLPVPSTVYDEIQAYIQHDFTTKYTERQLVQTYQEFHAIIVEWAKTYCRKRTPTCTDCPLQQNCRYKKTLE